MKIKLSWSGFRWFGVIVILASYFLVSQGYLDGKSVIFNAMNGIGSLFLIVNSYALKPRDWAIIVFNVIWLVIAVVSIVKIF